MPLLHVTRLPSLGPGCGKKPTCKWVQERMVGTSRKRQCRQLLRGFCYEKTCEAGVGLWIKRGFFNMWHFIAAIRI